MALRAVAQRGSADFIVANVHSDGMVKKTLLGYIVIDGRVTGSASNVLSLIARGYWEKVTNQEAAMEAVNLVRQTGYRDVIPGS